MKKCLYKFYVDCGRMGEIYGIFTSSKKEVSDIIGKTVYFGEILGKHSDISFTIKENHFTLLSKDDDFIEKFATIIGNTGHNPFDYIDNDNEEEDEEFYDDEEE